jgi:hypothetical protein
MSQPNLDSLNSFLEKATKAISCDPECQKKRKAELLEQRFNDAKTNLHNAPSKLHTAAKKYYTFTQGEDGYKEYIETELKKKVDEIASKKQEEFDANVATAIEETSIYEGLMLNYQNVVDLYTKYKDENDKMTRDIKTTRADILTNDRKTFYEDQGISNLTFYYSIIQGVYILCIIIFAALTLLAPSQFSIKIKLAVLVLFIIYPFISTKLLVFFIGIYSQIVNILPKNVNRNP